MTDDRLWYMGRAMEWTPVSWPDEREALERIAREGVSKVVQLEPGDGTRYDLWITVTTPDASGGRALFVSRIRSGHTGLVCIYAGAADDLGNPNLPASLFTLSTHSAHVLAEGNDWSEMFLGWWLDGLLLRLANLSAKEVNV